jgi:hypothetical protein
LDSNEIDESAKQDEKHFRHRISTLHGITIDSSDDKKNADRSIRANREGDSNEIDENESQHEKHCPQRILTLDGITID